MTSILVYEYHETRMQMYRSEHNEVSSSSYNELFKQQIIERELHNSDNKRTEDRTQKALVVANLETCFWTRDANDCVRERRER